MILNQNTLMKSWLTFDYSFIFRYVKQAQAHKAKDIHLLLFYGWSSVSKTYLDRALPISDTLNLRKLTYPIYTARLCLKWFLWHEKNHVMQVMLIKVLYKEDVYTKNIMLWKNQVMWGLAVLVWWFVQKFSLS